MSHRNHDKSTQLGEKAKLADKAVDRKRVKHDTDDNKSVTVKQWAHGLKREECPAHGHLAIKRERANSHSSDDTCYPASQRVSSSPSSAGIESPRRRRRSSPRSPSQPRWHNQSFMLFLALRQHPAKSLPRTDLIKAALALDRKISEERDLPKVFRGKTPMNSASAILTNNNDRYFVPFKPDGSRSMHFRLAFEPGDLTDTIQEYRQWEKALVQDEWPYYFGAKRSHEEQVVALELAALPVKDSPHHTVYMTEFDEFMANRRRQTQNEAKKENYPHSHHHQEKRKKSTKAWIPKLREHDIPLDQLDLANVPKSWKDIIRVDESRIRHGGKGVFATRRLPAHTPLGFYFGVPMTEDEFDSMKEDVGRASEYSMMYRKTVLDATNAEGQPYTDPNGDIFCPFHFINGASETEPNVAFTEGTIANQMVCWTKKEIRAGEELLI